MELKLRRKLGKKGIFYTIIAITLLLALIFSTNVGYQHKYREQSSIVETRVQTMDKFMDDLADDVEKGVRIASYRSVIGMTNYVVDTLSYIDDSNQRFEELFYYGTIYGNHSPVVEDNAFVNWTQNMQEQANNIGLEIAFDLVDLDMQQTGPWTIKVSMNLSVEVTDTRGIASWDESYTIISTISIEGFEDPLYAMKTGNGITKSIEITPYENDYVSGSDVTNLEIHLNSTYYAESDAAPSFMMRFEGDLNSSEYGIESLVDKQEVGTYFPCPAGTTNTDYLYWQCSSVNTWGVTGMPSWFYLDNQTVDSEGRLEKYEVEGLV